MKLKQYTAAVMSLLVLSGCSAEFSITEPVTEVTTTAETTGTTTAQADTTAPAQSADTTTADTTVPQSTEDTATSAPQSSGSTAQTSRTQVTSGTQSTAGTSQTESTASTTEAQQITPGANLSEIMRSMSLEQKAAQLILASCSDAGTANKAAQAGVGGLCLFAKPFSGKTKAQVREMTAGFQKNAGIPLLISVDEEGGSINRISLNPNLRAVPFWSGKALYAEGGWELVTSDTKEKAELLLSLGVNVNLAPVCDVPLDASNYIYNRCFSLDATETAEYIRVVVGEMKANGLGSTLKHFPGYGGSVDTHKNMGYDDRDYTAFSEGDFLPFIAGIETGADSVMVSHNIVSCMDSSYPASLSPAVHSILRGQLGFKGVIISDDLGMDAITQFTGGQNPAVAAICAGNDLICYADFEKSIPAIVAAVHNGTIDERQIDDSVLRILAWKRSLGLI